MVEAALVFPLVILTVMALIYILIFLYQQTEIRAQMHIALRAESGKSAGTVEYLTTITSAYPVYQKGRQVYYQGTIEFNKRGILGAGKKELSAHGYVNDEKAFIRSIDLLRIREETNEK